MSDESFGACYAPAQHSCEICGLSGLSDDLMREHTMTCHVEGNAQCPFCGYGGVVSAELLLHVNQAHLDYLTPENELISFIDDRSPSGDGDSDSLSEQETFEECGSFSKINRLYSQFDNSETNFAIPKQNSALQSTFKSSNNYKIQKQPEQLKNNCTPSCSTKSFNKRQDLKSQIHTNNQLMEKENETYKSSRFQNTSNNVQENKVTLNGFGFPHSSNSQGSPSRSNLGLKLKTCSSTSEKHFLQCPLCPYTSQNSTELEEHINRSHFDPLSPLNGSYTSNNQVIDNVATPQCPICSRIFASAPDLELHVNIEHRDILSPGKTKCDSFSIAQVENICPICNIPLEDMKPQEVEVHIEEHFTRSSKNMELNVDYEKQAQKLREQREFEMLRAQYGMDDQGNFREQSAAAMQRAVYAGEMSVADYYERQVGLRAAESHGIDDSTSCTKSVSPRVLSLSSSSPGVIKSLICTSVDHYASSYGDKGWGCGYRNLQILLSSLLQNTTFNEALYSAWGNQGPSRTAMPSISRLQKMVEAAWAQGFDVQGSEQLGCKLYNTRKWIGATEIVTVLSWLRINCQLIDFHRPTSQDGRHPELFNWVLQYFDEPRVHTAPLYLQHQGHSRTIIGIEKRLNGLTLLILDPSHGPRQVAALGASQDSLRLIRRGPTAMRAPQYQIVAVQGLIETEEQYQASKILRSLRVPPDR